MCGPYGQCKQVRAFWMSDFGLAQSTFSVLINNPMGNVESNEGITDLF